MEGPIKQSKIKFSQSSIVWWIFFTSLGFEFWICREEKNP